MHLLSCFEKKTSSQSPKTLSVYWDTRTDMLHKHFFPMQVPMQATKLVAVPTILNT